MEVPATGTIIEWRGPAPFWFLPFTGDDSAMIDELKPMFTEGRGLHPRHRSHRPDDVHDVDHAEGRPVPDPARGRRSQGRGRRAGRPGDSSRDLRDALTLRASGPPLRRQGIAGEGLDSLGRC